MLSIWQVCQKTSLDMKYAKLTLDAFLALLRAGLWEHGVQLSAFEPIDYDSLYNLADEQSVVGLIAAGLEHVEDVKVVKKDALSFLKKVFGLEGRNASMNAFIERLVDKLRGEGIIAVLVKGQGIAQCYERPQWRSAGDVDLLLNKDNYEKAIATLAPITSHFGKEDKERLHYGLKIDSFDVELHGSLRSRMPQRVNAVIDEVQDNTFRLKNMRIWRDRETDVFLPATDNDIVFVFTHILQHLFEGGIGLRQICDWCRFLWTYRGTLDLGLLGSRLKRMGLRTEWQVFACLAVNHLGMPISSMPFYQDSMANRRKARRLLRFILETGSFGHNRDSSYIHKKPYVARKLISLVQGTRDAFVRFYIFPLDSMCLYFKYLFNSMATVMRGE